MRKFNIASLLLISIMTTPCVAQSAGNVFITDPNTGEKKELTIEQSRNPAVLTNLLPKHDGVEDIFKAYLKVGYAPMHSYLLTNSEVLDLLIKNSNEEIPESPEFANKIKEIKDMYVEIK